MDDNAERSSWVRRPDADATAEPAPPGAGEQRAAGSPGLPPPAKPPTWAMGDHLDQPTPGMAAPGRHGWARSEATYTPKVSDGAATKALILGVVALVSSLFVCGLILGPAAIIDGVKALRRISSSGGGLTGRPRAITAIGLGSVATFVSALSLLATLVAIAAS